uniref:Protein kinase domain-containing protein n=1 Tax=Elaeophora elaphi TaxID=1147741 RepID=A0A0R3S378_9BILA
MDLFGKNIRELKKSTKEDCFTMITSLWIMKKMILALKFLHRLGWIHRDVKPANFCVGLKLQGTQELYLVDFGMARHIFTRNGVIKTRRASSAFHGTVRYASLTAHRHQDMSRYDDLWSVYYISVENMIGQLPWRYVNEKREVEKMKEGIDLLKQEYGTEVKPPASLVVFHHYLSHAGFYHEPEYHHIVSQIDLDLSQRNFNADSRLDWQPVEPCQRVPSNDFKAKNHRELRDSNTANHNHSSSNLNHSNAGRAENDDQSFYFMQTGDNF